MEKWKDFSSCAPAAASAEKRCVLCKEIQWWAGTPLYKFEGTDSKKLCNSEHSVEKATRRPCKN